MSSVAPSFRRFAAGLLIVAAVLAALWIGSYKQLDTHVGGQAVVTREVAKKFGLEMTPAWAIPVAVTVGVLGLALALLIYRGRNE